MVHAVKKMTSQLWPHIMISNVTDSIDDIVPELLSTDPGVGGSTSSRPLRKYEEAVGINIMKTHPSELPALRAPAVGL